MRHRARRIACRVRKLSFTCNIGPTGRLLNDESSLRTPQGYSGDSDAPA
jgi:hypothetical protein